MILVFESEKSNAFARYVSTIAEAKEKAEQIIKDRGYEVQDWYLYEEDEPCGGECTFVYSHPCRFEDITLFDV